MPKLQARKMCRDCNGHGRKRVLHEANSDGGYWSIEHCETCSGSGFVIVTSYTPEPDPQPTACYSDHAEDLRTKGACEMCGESA